MTKESAIEIVLNYVRREYPSYPVDDLKADRFDLGWVVFAASDPSNMESLRVGQTIFLLGDNGEIMESSSSLPPGVAEDEFRRLHSGSSNSA